MTPQTQFSYNHPVAYLCLQNTEHPSVTDEVAIYPNDEFDIGRREIQDVWDGDELTISTHHLRFWCVLYEDESELEVAPMVYVRVLSSNKVLLSRLSSGGVESRHTFGSSDPNWLLNQGDVLHLTHEISVHFHFPDLRTAQSGNFDSAQMAEMECFKDQFDVSDRRLGVGGFASVFVAVKQRTQRQVACKILPLSSEDEKELQRIRNGLRLDSVGMEQALKAFDRSLMKSRRTRAREYEVQKGLDHPNIITLEKVICATRCTYIFQELITGGDLLSYLDKNGALDEARSAVIVRQILKAVDYLHDNRVVHRDIKPENILMSSWRDGARVVLTDFGQSRTFEEAKAEVRKSGVIRMHTLVGTAGYVAPEVYKQLKRELRDKGYSKAIDIWSIGCLAATLLTNNLIFTDEANEESILLADPRTKGSSQRWNLNVMEERGPWMSVSRKAKSFIRGCLELNEDERFTAKQALLHVWFTDTHYADDIEAAYQRAIQDWKPRGQERDVVEFIDSSDGVHEAELASIRVTRQTAEARSRYFDVDSSPPPPKTSLFYKAAKRQPQQSMHTPPPCPLQPRNTDEETMEFIPDSPRLETAEGDG